jgi:hypothetical protein
MDELETGDGEHHASADSSASSMFNITPSQSTMKYELNDTKLDKTAFRHLQSDKLFK